MANIPEEYLCPINLEIMKFINKEGLQILKLEQDTAIKIKELM